MSRTYRCRHLPKLLVKKWSKDRTYQYVRILKYFDGARKGPKTVANASWHPWVKWWKRANAGVKRYYRRVGNKALRAEVRRRLKDETKWDDSMPLVKDYVDWWDLY